MSQVQCPNCGGYKVSIATDYIRKVPFPWGKRIFLVVLLQLYFLCVVPELTRDSSSSFTTLSLVGDLLFSLYVLFVVKDKKTVGYQYHCQLCGYRWDWYIGDPLPQVTAQPDLVAKGAQRLQQEEEEARKRQQDLEALYHLTHQKK